VGPQFPLPASTSTSTTPISQSSSAAEPFSDREALITALAPLCEVLSLPAPPAGAADDIILAALREARRRVQSEFVHVVHASAVDSWSSANAERIPGDFTNEKVRSVSSVFSAAAGARDLNAHADATAARRAARAKVARVTLMTSEGAMRELERVCDSKLRTGNAKVDAAGSALRIMFGNDLRDLQHTVNEVLAMTQEFTADPVTRARKIRGSADDDAAAAAAAAEPDDEREG
jgi:hypothetical protein